MLPDSYARNRSRELPSYTQNRARRNGFLAWLRQDMMDSKSFRAILRRHIHFPIYCLGFREDQKSWAEIVHWHQICGKQASEAEKHSKSRKYFVIELLFAGCSLKSCFNGTGKRHCNTEQSISTGSAAIILKTFFEKQLM